MKAKELLKSLIEQNGLTNAGVAKAMGTTPQALWNTLNMSDRKTMSVDRVVEILDVMGYKLVAVPKAQTVKNSLEVE